jgi:hypothetical protein
VSTIAEAQGNGSRVQMQKSTACEEIHVVVGIEEKYSCSNGGWVPGGQ